MFKLEPNPTFAVTVQITEPGGTTRPLNVVFRHKTRSVLLAWLDQKQSDLAMALDVVESIAELPEGMTIKDFLEKLFEAYPASALDLYLTYRRELLESRIKN